MGAFVAVYNALSFRLVAAPYHLSQVALAAVFLVYAIGSLSSRYAGLLADRIGRRAVLPAAIALAAGGLALTNVSSLPLIIAGIAILTAGFFAGHSVASSWIGRCAHKSPAQASALYLLAYYIGSSIAGPGPTLPSLTMMSRSWNEPSASMLIWRAKNVPMPARMTVLPLRR